MTHPLNSTIILIYWQKPTTESEATQWMNA